MRYFAFTTRSDNEIRLDSQTMLAVSIDTDDGNSPMSVRVNIETPGPAYRAVQVSHKTAQQLDDWCKHHVATGLFTEEDVGRVYVYRRKQHAHQNIDLGKPADAPKNPAEQEFERLAAKGNAELNAIIDVKIEQVMTMAMGIGNNPDFIHDIAPALRMIIRAVATDAYVQHDKERRAAFRDFIGGERTSSVGPLVVDGKVPSGLPVEEKMRPGEKPFGYVVGMLSKEALECLQDVVSHAGDFRSALAARRIAAQKDDRESADHGQPAVVPGGEESYWVKQQEVFERMVNQAKAALDIYAKVTQ